jgi:ATP-dependent Clp protease protease subunit
MNLEKMLGKDRDTDEIWVNDFNEDAAGKFRDDLMSAAKGDPKRPIIVYIDSYGGAVDALASMIESMDEVQNPIITVAVGKAMSCGAVLLSHGDIRFCSKNARVMIHEVSGGVQNGDVHDQFADATEVKRLNEWFMGLLAKNCGIKGGYNELRKLVKEQDGRDRYLDSADALKFGIVDVVGMPKVEKVSMYQVGVVPPKVKLAKAKESKKPTKTAKKKSRR